MSDETQSEPEFAFAEGQEVALAASGLRAKVVSKAVDAAGRPVYRVVYAAVAEVPEAGLTAAEG
ncbi:MAG: hypothetical protein K2X87_09185 [Gemmataceae bacterium]|nr:hypothetical protein [Gemmataceae bacterium]